MFVCSREGFLDKSKYLYSKQSDCSITQSDTRTQMCPEILRPEAHVTLHIFARVSPNLIFKIHWSPRFSEKLVLQNMRSRPIEQTIIQGLFNRKPNTFITAR